MKKRKIIFILALLAISGGAAEYFHLSSTSLRGSIAEQTAKKDKYQLFLEEVYGKIQNHYWDEIGDDKLSELFRLGAEKLSERPQNLETANVGGTAKMVLEIIKEMDEIKKKEFVSGLADIVLANLQPFSRSRLYTTKEEESLK